MKKKVVKNKFEFGVGYEKKNDIEYEHHLNSEERGKLNKSKNVKLN